VAHLFKTHLQHLLAGIITGDHIVFLLTLNEITGAFRMKIYTAYKILI